MVKGFQATAGYMGIGVIQKSQESLVELLTQVERGVLPCVSSSAGRLERIEDSLQTFIHALIESARDIQIEKILIDNRLAEGIACRYKVTTGPLIEVKHGLGRVAYLLKLPGCDALRKEFVSLMFQTYISYFDCPMLNFIYNRFIKARLIHAIVEQNLEDFTIIINAEGSILDIQGFYIDVDNTYSAHGDVVQRTLRRICFKEEEIVFWPQWSGTTIRHSHISKAIGIDKIMHTNISQQQMLELYATVKGNYPVLWIPIDMI